MGGCSSRSGASEYVASVLEMRESGAAVVVVAVWVGCTFFVAVVVIGDVDGG